MKRLDDNYYSRRCQQAYENGRKDGIIYMTIVFFAVMAIVCIIARLG